MPGPRNSKKKTRAQAKKEKEKRQKNATKQTETTSERQPMPYQPLRSQPLRYSYDTHIPKTKDTRKETSSDDSVLDRRLRHPHDAIYVHDSRLANDDHKTTFTEQTVTCLPIDPIHLMRPCLEDTGDGLRVLDVFNFVFDSRLASPPSLDDALCAEFAQEEILDMLCTVLPEECATVLTFAWQIMWYNKTRTASRICPVCKRLYRVGDVLDPSPSRSPPRSRSPSPHNNTSPAKDKRRKEQEISGICSGLCFFLAAHTFPTALRALWGRSAREIDAETAAALDLCSLSSLPRLDLSLDVSVDPYEKESLGILLKMTRCGDLGLQQIFFAEVDISGAASESQESDEEAGYDAEN
ncbi:hypothetical protein EIP86_002586 [Pleurotus ostreatoroseus]|nr:hypothetical protein EIP86_002586 [Pleurotus ostreatoroseus]